ncbi:glycosyltransferase family 4 protein [Chryseobacterium sp.]|uniref:glycosyltransferase family 4 protein n=1 Tax=Chryseobacterium sp. TaxID=1871047 RepID=UPI0025BC1FCA|nr:glycosyltransferase family 4 protein [Chryseobacterium sp.]
MIDRLKKIFQSKKKVDLLLYDTIFPNPISGFRMAEFTALLKHYDHSKIIVNPTDYKVVHQSESQHSLDLKALEENSKLVYNKIKLGSLKDILNINAKLFYCVFLNIIFDCLPYLEKNKTDFIFTLYPGGGFNTKNESSLKKLKTVLNSPFFKGVIVTQEFTRNFIIEKFNCPEDKIHYIFGGIIPQNSINIERQRRYKNGDSLNICFCSAKYMSKGLDKGFDVFIESAKLLLKRNYNVKFSIIGGFDKDEIPLDEFSDSFTFYGYRKYEDLSEIFLEQDIIVSPNRPFILNDGSFDGFPLGAVVEAALNGVIPVITDELQQNSHFSESEIIIIKPEVEDVFQSIEHLINNEKTVYLISQNIQAKCRKIYSNENQLNQRLKILDQNIYD